MRKEKREGSTRGKDDSSLLKLNRKCETVKKSCRAFLRTCKLDTFEEINIYVSYLILKLDRILLKLEKV